MAHAQYTLPLLRNNVWKIQILAEISHFAKTFHISRENESRYPCPTLVEQRKNRLGALQFEVHDLLRNNVHVTVTT